MLQVNNSELKTNETLITQVTNALFYKEDKNRLQPVGCISGINSLTKHKTKATLKTLAKITYLLYSLIKYKTKITLVIVSKITCILLLCNLLLFDYLL